MQLRPSLIERALQLARSGDYANKSEIVKVLKGDGYQAPATELEGKAITRQIRALIAAARGSEA